MKGVTIEEVSGWAVLIISGSFGTELLRWWTRRRAEHTQQREPVGMTRAAAEFSEALSGGSTDLLKEFRREFRFLRRRAMELQRGVDTANSKATAAEGRAKIAERLAEEAKAEHERCESKLSAMRDEIAAMVASSRIAAFGEPVPKELKS